MGGVCGHWRGSISLLCACVWYWSVCVEATENARDVQLIMMRPGVG